MDAILVLDSIASCNILVTFQVYSPIDETRINESGKSESGPRRAPDSFQAIPAEELSQVEFSSHCVNIREAEISTTPAPETAFRDNSALRISMFVGKATLFRSNSTRVVLEVLLLLSKLLLPIDNPFPLLVENGKPSSR